MRCLKAHSSDGLCKNRSPHAAGAQYLSFVLDTVDLQSTNCLKASCQLQPHEPVSIPALLAWRTISFKTVSRGHQTVVAAREERGCGLRRDCGDLCGRDGKGADVLPCAGCPGGHRDWPAAHGAQELREKPLCSSFALKYQRL